MVSGFLSTPPRLISRDANWGRVRKNMIWTCPLSNVGGVDWIDPMTSGKKFIEYRRLTAEVKHRLKHNHRLLLTKGGRVYGIGFLDKPPFKDYRESGADGEGVVQSFKDEGGHYVQPKYVAPIMSFLKEKKAFQFDAVFMKKVVRLSADKRFKWQEEMNGPTRMRNTPKKKGESPKKGYAHAAGLEPVSGDVARDIRKLNEKMKGGKEYCNKGNTKVTYSKKAVQLARAAVKDNKTKRLEAESLAAQKKPSPKPQRSKLTKMHVMKTFVAAAKVDKVPQTPPMKQRKIPSPLSPSAYSPL